MRTVSNTGLFVPLLLVLSATAAMGQARLDGGETPAQLRERHAELARERALYRLVLGMPDQADLLSHLSSHATALDAEAIRNACLNLCAFDRVARPRSGH